MPDSSQRAIPLAAGRARFFNSLQEVRNEPSECCRFVRVPCFHADDLCNSMTVGRLYRVIGFPAAHGHPLQGVSWSVEANGVQPLLPECEAGRHLSHLNTLI